MKKKKGFTLIELIAVLVIMSILALIVTPLVMSIIKKARVAADKRSIDAYGRSIELAVASYLLDTGKFPTSVEQLTIEYSGNEVVCETTQLNSDSSVYLTECTVGGKSVDYAYGKDTSPIVYDSYLLGDQVTYNNITYYVIEDSGENEENVKLLKSEPLTKAEMDGLNLEGVSINNDYISQTNYGLVQYGESNDYKVSTVKKIVDSWSNTAIKSGDNAKSRLITMDDLFSDLG